MHVIALTNSNIFHNPSFILIVDSLINFDEKVMKIRIKRVDVCITRSAHYTFYGAILSPYYGQRLSIAKFLVFASPVVDIFEIFPSEVGKLSLIDERFQPIFISITWFH